LLPGAVHDKTYLFQAAFKMKRFSGKMIVFICLGNQQTQAPRMTIVYYRSFVSLPKSK
jgi:hypothetical protein